MRQKINTRNIIILTIDCQENAFSTILWVFSAANFPARKAIVSLVNLPIRKAGIIYLDFIFAIPAPKKSGVVGSGNKEYASTIIWPFHLFSLIFSPRY